MEARGGEDVLKITQSGVTHISVLPPTAGEQSIVSVTVTQLLVGGGGGGGGVVVGVGVGVELEVELEVEVGVEVEVGLEIEVGLEVEVGVGAPQFLIVSYAVPHPTWHPDTHGVWSMLVGIVVGHAQGLVICERIMHSGCGQMAGLGSGQ